MCGVQLCVPGVRLPQVRPTGIVQRLPLPGGGPQQDLLGLTVGADEQIGQFGQRRHRDGPPPDVRAAAAGGGDRPGGEQFAFIVSGRVQVGAGVPCPGRGRAVGPDQKRAFHHGPPGPLPHQVGVGSGSQQKPERGDHHRLARTGLAGEHVEAASELQIGLGDHPEITNA